LQHKFQLRTYQQSAVDAGINFAKYGDGNGYITIPTGGGKSLCIAALAQALTGKVLALAHRKELLEQNADKFTEKVGIYSAGLGQKDTTKRITIAGVQSIANNPPDDIDWVLIDECHHLNNDMTGQYWQLIYDLGSPRIIGFTATPFRLDGGTLSWGEEIFSIGYQPLIDNKYLTPLINKQPFELNFTADVRLGDYVLSQLADEMIDPELLRRSVEKIAEYSVDRNSVLIFVTTLKHGRLLQQVMSDNGLYAIMVDGDTPAEERAQIAEEFRHGELRYVINCMIWTEGFDAPNIDMLAVLRPTMSKALHEQIIGRAVRICECKENALILDLAGNFIEHGGLGSPFKSEIKGKNKEQGRICPSCESVVFQIKATECPDCGYQFPPPEVRKVNHNYEADTESSVIYQPKNTSYPIKDVMYRHHQSKKGNQTLRVDYIHEGFYGNSTSEYLSPYSESEWAKNKVWLFFKERGVLLKKLVEEHTIGELIELAQNLKKPTLIEVDESDKYPRIKGYIYGETNRESNTESNSELVYEEYIF